MSQNMPEQSINQDWSYIKRLLSYLKGEQRLLLSTLICLIVYGFAQAYSPALIAKIIDEHITQNDYNSLVTTILLLLGTYVLLLLSFRFQLIWLGTLGQKVLVKLRSSIFEKMQQLSLGFYYENEPGDLMSRLINDTSNVGTLFSQSIAQTLGSSISLIAILIAMFVLDWRLALATFLIVPIMIWLTIYFSKRSRKAFQKSSKSLGDLSSNIEEELRLVRESQSFAREAFTISMFEQTNATNRDANIEAIRITAAFSPSIDVLSTIAQVIVIAYGAYLAFLGYTSVGVVVAFLAYVQRFYRPIQMLSNFYTQLQSTLASAERIFKIIDSPVEEQHAASVGPISEVYGLVRFNQVSFGYHENQTVLNDISFSAKPGESIAFIGETGVGKSTTINLIPRFYNVLSGAVTIDETNVNDIELNSLRSYIAEVPQSLFLFNRSILENIGFGNQEIDETRAIESAKSAQAHEFISELPDGYHTVIGSGGYYLSRGQQQLLCIARAIYANPRILLLDEATSNIDSQTERLVQNAINKVLKGRTSFVIAHRLTTIKNVDKIIVLGKDGIIEMGNHDELMKQGGYYKTIIEKEYES